MEDRDGGVLFKPAGGRLGGKFADPGSDQNIQHGALGLHPNRMSRAAGFSVARSPGDQANIQLDGSVDGLDHLVHGCLATARQDFKAPRLPSPRGDQLGAYEGLQHLREEALRSIRGLGQRGQQRAFMGR